MMFESILPESEFERIFDEQIELYKKTTPSLKEEKEKSYFFIYNSLIGLSETDSQWLLENILYANSQGVRNYLEDYKNLVYLKERFRRREGSEIVIPPEIEFFSIKIEKFKDITRDIKNNTANLESHINYRYTGLFTKEQYSKDPDGTLYDLYYTPLFNEFSKLLMLFGSIDNIVDGSIQLEGIKLEGHSKN